ncbi:MAG: adenylate kinase [Actinobacteria bacterium]|nr:adenylate kinase [Actinomycetota bacterium]
MTVRGPRVVLLGKQGAGKGTQVTRVAEHYAVAHLATGDLFRAAARDGTPLGVKARRYIDRGELVPDDIVIGVVREFLTDHDGALAASGFVLDGFPRTRVQAEELDVSLGDERLDIVVNLDVPTEVVLARIAGRRVCVQCGATYHVDHSPRDPWWCDHCGGHVLQRDDDQEDSVMRRLELYEIQTLPVIQYYRRSGKLVSVNGEADSESVFTAVITAIDARREAPE